MHPPAHQNGHYRVFLSHGGEDTYIAQQFFKPKLLASGAEVFVDEGEIIYGEDFRATLLRELAACDELVVLLTPSSVRRPWVFAELGAVVLRQVHVVAIRYGVTEEELRELGILSILGTRRLLVPAECDKYVEQLRTRVEGKRDV